MPPPITRVSYRSGITLLLCPSVRNCLVSAIRRQDIPAGEPLRRIGSVPAPVVSWEWSAGQQRLEQAYAEVFGFCLVEDLAGHVGMRGDPSLCGGAAGEEVEV